MPTFNYAIRVPPRVHSRLFSTDNPLVAADACKASLDLVYGRSKLDIRVVAFKSPNMLCLSHPNSPIEFDAVIQPGRLLVPVVAVQWMGKSEDGWKAIDLKIEGFEAVDDAKRWVENEVVFGRAIFDQDDGVMVAYAQDCRLSVATIYEIEL